MAKQTMTIEMVTIAILDKQNLYQGVDCIPQDQLKENHVEVPADCDLMPGLYYWDDIKKTFLPTQQFLKQLLDKKLAKGKVSYDNPT